MKILLINQSNGVDFNENPPLGILHIAASLRKAGNDVDIYDQGAKENELQYPSPKYIKDFSPDIAGFSLYTFGLPQTLQYIKELKRGFPYLKIVVGGHHATALTERTMLDCPEADFLVYGEGDITIVELVRAIETSSDVAMVRGICYRDGQRIVKTEPRPFIQNLDELPFPANDLIEKYTYPSEGIGKGKKVLNLTASRGCPFHCAYCNKAVYGSSYRRRTVKSVADEIEYMFNQFGYDEVMFHDELFTAKKSWVYELMEEFGKRGLKFPWRCLGKVGTVDLAMLTAMRQSGCYIISFGLEAGNERVREDINRHMSNEDIINTFSLAKKAGIITYAFNMINHRLDTIDTIRDTYNLMCEVNPTFAPVFICSPLPGSPVYQYLPDDIKYDWDKFNSYRCFGGLPISISSVPPEDLMFLADQMEAFYYSRARYFFEHVSNLNISIKVKKLIIMMWLGFMLSRIKHMAQDRYFVTMTMSEQISSSARFLSKLSYKAIKGVVGLFKDFPAFKKAYSKLS